MQTFEAVKSAYNLRSKVVHGDFFSLPEIVQTTETVADLARRVLCRFLETDAFANLFGTNSKQALDDFLKRLGLGVPIEPNAR